MADISFNIACKELKIANIANLSLISSFNFCIQFMYTATANAK